MTDNPDATADGRAVRHPDALPDGLVELARTIVSGWRTPPPPTWHPDLLASTSEIACYLEVCERTVWNWYMRHGLPALPHKGELLTTTQLLCHWVWERSDTQREQFLVQRMLEGRTDAPIY